MIRFIVTLVTMILALGVVTPTETPAPSTAPPTQTTVAPCVTIGLDHEIVTAHNETVTTADAITPAPDSEWIYTGNWDGHVVQVAVIGNYLNYGFDQRGAFYEDMELQSVDVAHLDQVTICR